MTARSGKSSGKESRLKMQAWTRLHEQEGDMHRALGGWERIRPPEHM